jgi:hypothetical protein
MSLRDKLQAIADAEDGPKEVGGIFGTKPIRWWDDTHWRCENDHVSVCLLNTDHTGEVCINCWGYVWLTFPEDQDGPLGDPNE